MKKEEIPQDKSSLTSMTRELYYVKNKDGKYDTGLSTGWDPKTVALENEWNRVHERIEEAKQAVLNGEKSPIYYYMEKNIMDLGILSGHVGYWKFSIKKHLRPSVFKRLSHKVLDKYAKAFDITVEELQNFNANLK